MHVLFVFCCFKPFPPPKKTQNIFSSQKESQNWQVLPPFFPSPVFQRFKTSTGERRKKTNDEIQRDQLLGEYQTGPAMGRLRNSVGKEVPNEEPMGKPTENTFFCVGGYN